MFAETSFSDCALSLKLSILCSSKPALPYQNFCIVQAGTLRGSTFFFTEHMKKFRLWENAIILMDFELVT